MSNLVGEQSLHRKLANPGALGLAAFALTTFLLSCFNAGVLVSATGKNVVFGVAYIYGGIAQLIAGVIEFLFDNIFGATAFVSYGSFWISFAYFEERFIENYPPEIKGEIVGLYLFCWMMLTLMFLLLSIKITRAHFVLFLLLFLTFFLLVIGNFWDLNGLVRSGGWFGILTALCAWYIMLSIMSTSIIGKTILPLGIGGFNIRFLAKE
ncbi:uncharacterized protein LOC126326529 [Schistocerca gregaria]|uniref:uncharacterized protein LOC126326529 n=1 Tax=Schistocerca gregaria TaxID=7010 RepID=UPI00211E311B|nr:uncharacterized protein LOC126326529 [Schistocerca gregaria]